MKGLPFLILLFALSAKADAIVYERFEQDGKVGIRDDRGHVVVPASFDALGWSDGSFTVIGQITGYRSKGHWGLLNLKKEFITEALYLSLTYPGGDRTLASREINSYTTKYGCVNLKGELTVPFVYDAIEIHDLRAVVMKKNGARYEYGLIDLNNQIILPLIYRKVEPLGTLRYAIQNFSGKTAICSEEGKWSTGFDIDSVSAFRHDLAVLYKDLHLGVIDRSGEIRVEPVYRDVRIAEPGKVQTKKADAWRVIDLHQKELQRLEADELEPIGLNRNRAKFNGLSGVVDSVFNKVLPIEFDYIGTVNQEKLIVGKQNRFGLIRTDQSVILPIEFDSLILEGHLIRASHTERGIRRWDLYDTVGVRKTTTFYEFIGPWNGKFFPILEHGYEGAIDRVGKEKIAPVYDSLIIVDEMNCVVKFKGQFGIISLEDRWKIPPQRNRLQLLPGGLYMEIEGNLRKIMDFSGQLLYFTDNPLFIFPDHLAERLPDGTEKEINFQGQIISRKTAVAVLEQQSFQEHEGLTVIRRDGKYGFVDGRGRLRIANRYEGAGDFNEGLAPIRLLGKWGFIDKTDQIIVQPAYDKMPMFRDGVAHVVRNGKEGLVDRSGALLLDLRYDNIQYQIDGSYLLMKDGLMGLADAAGKILLEPRFESLEPAGPHHVIVKQNGRYGLLTRDGLSVFPIRYDHLVYQRGTETFFVRESFPWETVEIK